MFLHYIQLSKIYDLIYIYIHTYNIYIHIYRVSQEECDRYPKLNGYGDNGQRKV
jgi:hypothetical protein